MIAYPTDIVTEDGWARIHQGHGLDQSILQADLTDAAADAVVVHVEEVHLWCQPRVMWCGRHGDACESEGEWHCHWHQIRPCSNLATLFTIVRYGYAS